MPRGGARKGSGRPRIYKGRDTTSITVSVPSELVERIDAIAYASGASRTYTLTVLLERQLEALHEG